MTEEVQEIHSENINGVEPDLLLRKPVFEIIVISDVTCPWCWVAKRRLEYAIDSLYDKFNFKVHFSPFLINPTCPQEGLPNPDYNNPESLRAYHVREIGNELNLPIKFECPIIPYSVPALVLRQYIRESDYPNVVQSQVAEMIYEAYFTKGQCLTRDDLLTIAEDLMLNLVEVAWYLDDPANAQKVLEEASAWREQGVQAIPFFFMNGQACCSGAQETDDFVKTILKVAEKYPGKRFGGELGIVNEWTKRIPAN